MNMLFGLLLLLFCVLLAAQTANLFFITQADPLSRAIWNALGSFLSIGIWIVLATLFSLARKKGAFSSFSVWALVISMPLSFTAMITTADVFKSGFSERWLIVSASTLPLLLACFAVALWFEQLRAKVESLSVMSVFWGLILLLASIPFICRMTQVK